MSTDRPAIYGELVAVHHDLVTPANFKLAGQVCTLGRAPDCDIRVHDPLVSRLHARIERSGPRYLLSDAGSVNGTFVNGQRLLAPQLLRHNDRIGLGNARPLLHFHDADPTEVAASRLRYDERTMRFYLGDQPVDLTPTQFHLLHFLYQHADQVCSRAQCARAIWGRDYDQDHDSDALDQQLTSLRQRLRAANAQAARNLIVTRRGLGLVLQLSAEDEE